MSAEVIYIVVNKTKYYTTHLGAFTNKQMAKDYMEEEILRMFNMSNCSSKEEFLKEEEYYITTLQLKK